MMNLNAHERIFRRVGRATPGAPPAGSERALVRPDGVQRTDAPYQR
jgi:hypothetical protein